ncbi:hypothetical protein B0H19DRAFT_1195794 [Mycena capillaripes]|nr:hypothetical protein B0H19DRAFT_1195794 [Mycena capillaripes]
MRRRTLRRPGSVERYLSAEGSASSSPASLSSSHSSLPLPSIGVGAGANASVSYDASAGGGWGQVLPPLQRERDVDTEDWPRFTNAWGEELRANANASFQADLQRQMALRAGLGREREVPPVWGVRARVGDASDSDSAPVPVDADGWEPYEFQWDDAVRWVAAQGGDSLTQSEGVAGTRAQAQEDGGTRRDAQVQGGDDTPVVRHRYVDDDTLVRGDVYLPRASSPSTRSPTATPSASTSSSALPFTPPSAPDDADAGTTLARMRSLSRHLGALGARAAALDVAAENVRRHIEALGVPVPARPAFLGTAGGTPSAGVGTNMQAGQGRAEAREAAFAALLRATTNAPSSSVAPSLSTSSPAPGPTAPVDADADARRTALLARVGGLIATADAGAREAGAVLARARETRARLETQGVRTARAREILEGVHMRGEGEQEGRTPATGTAAGTGMDSGIEPLRRSMIAAQAALERVRTARRARVEGYAEIEATALASRPPPSGSRRVDEEKRPDPPPRRRTFFDR